MINNKTEIVNILYKIRQKQKERLRNVIVNKEE